MTALICPLCNDALRNDGINCPGCDAAYHRVCWARHRGLGCSKLNSEEHPNSAKIACLVALLLTWLGLVAIRVNYSFGFSLLDSPGVLIAILLVFVKLASGIGLVVAGLLYLRRKRGAKWVRRLGVLFLFSLTALVAPALFHRVQRARVEDQILTALEDYRTAHRRYPDSLSALSEPVLSQSKIRLGWDLRPLYYEATLSGAGYHVSFACPAGITADYDSTEGVWRSFD